MIVPVKEEFRVARRRAPMVFWTALGGAAVFVSLLSLLQPTMHVSGREIRIAPSPVLGVLGVLLVFHMQFVYAVRLRLELDGAGFSFRNLLRTRRVAWTDVESIESVSALTVQGRGGNQSCLRLRTKDGSMLIPDVFTIHRDRLRSAMVRRRDAAVSGRL